VWEAFLTLEGGIRKKPPKRHSQIREAFSTLDEAFEKRNNSIQACITQNLHKIIFILDKKRRAREKKKTFSNIP
jgi:hypothetical protein